MHLKSSIKKFLRLPGHQAQNQGYYGVEVPSDSEGDLNFNWKSSCSKSISFKVTDKCKSFFNAIKKYKGLLWTEECAEAFKKLKECLSNPPLLSKLIVMPKIGKTHESIEIYRSVSTRSNS